LNMLRRLLIISALVLCNALPASAGGPAYVAGSGFDQAVKGQSLTWAGGSLQYFTDQGDLSPILSGGQADVLVADVLTHWTGVPGAAITATFAGHLAEDVSSANVIGFPDGTYSIPNDIQSGALTTPVGIVYDADGQVTDALLGEGAGGLENCFTNAAYGGPDNFSSDAHLTHALVVINGVCIADTSKLPDIRYRLTRTLGRVLGLGWSQANPNVITRKPPPVTDDFEGFPLMHFLDPVGCVPISVCFPDADVPKMDDRAALDRLYPGNGFDSENPWQCVLHRCQWKCCTGDARSERRGAPHGIWPALAAVGCYFGFRICLPRQCGQSGEWLLECRGAALRLFRIR
jgi:hypothetical protein